ncbi:winged helix-turn-helix transcriptional regulator [Xylella taiwanensis]|uniref:MarR family transcriptional regulator n=1 Tax=Xylella taiwanensis TaxID=1444770 RepID=Z9JIP3_9GAMM|nr:MarR family winged helix-turn-helix transcriptional regulator [Xylella taiwanensis]AXI83880.1 MarR family transcriptional regulator [Xylella taiwanensis]EWS77612.1 MarR family transcriptional regulator [Xylella taiwanensis]MCD8456988.1 MarR family winged helix-turn-helix transcriptional regulator [Xylella taiwanensis]MCD8459399.1 MarR family winged helix-turn-helix transcriptional regulator [Xylella taiwanensis]MCD8461732.1 MarR family winged helix-turn-helix transcriptional regulator [Xyle
MNKSITTPHTIHINLEQFLPFRISVLSKHINNNIARIYENRYSMAATEWRVITILALYPGSSASKVSEHSAMDKVAVSRAVARLLKQRFIQRETHGDDRRRSMLTLSPTGHQVYETVAPLINKMENQLMSVLSENERQLLDHLIDRLTKEGLPRMILKG